MHISDVAIECAQQCARLARECSDKDLGIALYKISLRLLAAATHDTQLEGNEQAELQLADPAELARKFG